MVGSYLSISPLRGALPVTTAFHDIVWRSTCTVRSGNALLSLPLARAFPSFRMAIVSRTWPRGWPERFSSWAWKIPGRLTRCQVDVKGRPRPPEALLLEQPENQGGTQDLDNRIV